MLETPGNILRVGRLLWGFIVHATTWNVWSERNRRIFEDVWSPVEKVWTNNVEDIWQWCFEDVECLGIKLKALLFNWNEVFFT